MSSKRRTFRTDTDMLSSSLDEVLRAIRNEPVELPSLIEKLHTETPFHFVHLYAFAPDAPLGATPLFSFGATDASSSIDESLQLVRGPSPHGVVFRGSELTLPFFSSRLHASGVNRVFGQRLTKLGVHSLGTVPFTLETGGVFGILLVGFFERNHYFQSEERVLLQKIANYIGKEFTLQLPEPVSAEPVSAEPVSGPPIGETEASPHSGEYSEELSEREDQEDLASSPVEHREAEFQKLLQYGQLVLLKTDPNYRITEILGSSEKFFGYQKEELLGRSDMWEKLFDPQDLRRVALRLSRMGARVHEFGEELRFFQRGVDDARYLMLKATPVFDGDLFVGWEGFGVDITERRRVEQQLQGQRKRIEALYEVSRATRVNVDPAMVTLRGLHALIGATGSDAGLCCFYDEGTKNIEMVAAEGLSRDYLEGISSLVGGPNLVRYSIENRKGLLLDNVQKDKRAAHELARLEGLRSTVIMPLRSGDRILGSLVIFSRAAGRFSREDFQLVATAASQISVAARQAEFYAAEKEEAESTAVLYRLSHQIGKLFRAEDIGEHLFTVMHQVFASKRFWFGMVNNQRTHLIGQAGSGPGIRQQLKEVQVELGRRHDFLDEAITTKRPVVVPAGTSMECSGLNRHFERLQVGTLVVLPLVTLGQVIGVLVAEPVIGSPEYVQKKLPLLSRMAKEVAVVLMARRFEERVAESDKMRVAGVLASGVAHNFNNLLQAVMGQASLIQMQAQEDSPVQEYARTIIDSAGKGASLVKHLLSFSSPSTADREQFALSKFVEGSRDLYSSLLGGAIEMEFEIYDEDLHVVGDSQLIQQAVSNLLVNAREAIGEDPDGVVEISLRRVRLRSGEVDPSLSPGMYARIDIRDNGKGMDEERLERCFEPFYSSKDLDQSTGLSLTGAGLGLSSSYSLAKQHGGVLTASSARGEGTTLSFFIPLYEKEFKRAQALVPAPDVLKRTTLLIQPHGSTGYGVQQMFESFGMSSNLVHDLDEGHRVLGDEESDVHLVVVDADYLGKATLSFIERVRKQHRELPIVILTVSRDEWATGVAGFEHCLVVEKPLSMRSLQKVIQRFLDEGEETTTSGAGLSHQIEIHHSESPNGENPGSTEVSTPLGETSPPGARGGKKWH
jgi:PAS domain S-box-containing protein